jgi:hypothetical protein
MEDLAMTIPKNANYQGERKHILTNAASPEFKALVNDPTQMVIIGSRERPYHRLFFVDLEHNHFLPDTPINAAFTLIIVQWESLNYIVAVVPLGARSTAEMVAQNNGLRLADGIPHAFDHKGMRRFPVQNENAYTLEPLPDSEVYLPGGNLDARELERFLMSEILETHHDKMRLLYLHVAEQIGAKTMPDRKMFAEMTEEEFVADPVARAYAAFSKIIGEQQVPVDVALPILMAFVPALQFMTDEDMRVRFRLMLNPKMQAGMQEILKHHWPPKGDADDSA